MEIDPRTLIVGWITTTIMLLLVGQSVFYLAALGLKDRSQVFETLQLYRICTAVIMIGALLWISLI